jgi:hypothetical protein
MRKIVALLGLSALAGVMLTGCGVPAEEEARPIVVAQRSTMPPVPNMESGPVVFRLFLVFEGRLVMAERHLPADPGPAGAMQALLAGPTLQEKEAGITSALLGSTVMATVRVDSGQARVELVSSLEETGRNDDVLAFGQIVCTLTSLPGVSTVSFTQGGAALQVPQGDGPLTQEPLTLADYANLITGG